MKLWLRGSLATLLGSVTLLVASSAFAEGEACYNDDDCPNPACGGDVCNWGKLAAKADGRKIFYCQTAGQVAKGQDGWCETDTNCKCKATGATCVSSHCTDTGTPAAPTGGGSSAGGSAAGGAPSTAGTAAGGAPATTAGAPTSSAGTGTAPTTPATSSDSGGCSVSAPGNAGGAALLLAAVGVGFAFARRRR